MPPKTTRPSPLAVATDSVNRLVKEEFYYHKEQADQEKRIKKLEADIEAKNPDLDSNAEYILKQEVRSRRPGPSPVPYRRVLAFDCLATADPDPRPLQKTALEQTKRMFGPLRKQIEKAVAKLEEQLAIAESDGTASEEELKKARDAIESGRKVAEQEEKKEEKKE